MQSNQTIDQYLDSLDAFKVREINVNDKGLTYIPASIIRFTKLQILHCENNQLTELPQLPDSLEQLHCDNNLLIQLSPLDSNGNQLPMPATLGYLKCSNNHLTVIPTLEVLNRIHTGLISCVNNNISKLPNFSSTLLRLRCWDNPILQSNYPLIDFAKVRYLTVENRAYIATINQQL